MDYGMEDMAERRPASNDRPITEENTPDDTGETIHVPRDLFEGDQPKEGDTIQFKVVAVDDDGCDVAYEGMGGKEKESESSNDELDRLDQEDEGSY